jgi:hypothetical protein
MVEVPVVPVRARPVVAETTVMVPMVPVEAGPIVAEEPVVVPMVPVEVRILPMDEVGLAIVRRIGRGRGGGGEQAAGQQSGDSGGCGETEDVMTHIRSFADVVGARPSDPATTLHIRPSPTKDAVLCLSEVVHSLSRIHLAPHALK